MPPTRARGVAALLFVVVLASLTQQPRAVQQGQDPSTFRAGVNYVRADVYVTRDGRLVTDLNRDDFELLEDGVPQPIDKLELKTVQAAPADAVSLPRTLTQSRDLIATSGGRLFVVFLDTFHVEAADSMRVRKPLAAFLDRAIGKDDFVAVMTPAMSAADLSFERRGQSAERILAERWPWGQADRFLTTDPADDRYQMCYPAMPIVNRCPGSDGIAARMSARRHEKQTLDAFDDLVSQLETLREERKSVITLSHGWALYRPDDTLTRPIGCEPPPVPPAYKPPAGVPPPSRPPSGALPPTSTLVASDTSSCEGDRLSLAALDNEQQLRDIADRANRGNVTFYALDPGGGGPLFGRPISEPIAFGPEALDQQILTSSAAPVVDRATLERRRESLRELAAQTDGLAILNQNAIEDGFRRIANDISGYYLLGYYSTGKRDGKFHAIRVRVKRPGVEVRARRGYLAPSPDEYARAVGPAAPKTAAGVIEPAALTAALAGLAPLGRTTALRTDFVVTRAAAPVVWVQGEVDAQLRASESDVNIALADNAGNVLASRREHLGRDVRVFRVPLTPAATPADGQYVARIRLQSSTGEWDAVTVTATVAAASAGMPASGLLLNRRGPTTANRIIPAVDRRFRRSEQLIAELPLEAPRRFTAAVLDRAGAPLSLPVDLAERRDGDANWMTARVTLNPLTTGDYVLALTEEGGATIAVAFRLVP